MRSKNDNEVVVSLTIVRTRLDICVMPREDGQAMVESLTTSKAPSGHRVVMARTFETIYRKIQRILCIWSHPIFALDRHAQ